MTSLLNPLERLAYLPNAMNWKGAWNNAEQYYKNDLAISPTNNATYILFGSTTSTGTDPISDPVWFELLPHATGVEGLSAGNGIGLTPPATNPTITNTGIRTLTANTGLISATDPSGNANLINTGILGLVGGTGMSWDVSTNTLLNTGVGATIRFGFGNTGTAQNQVLSNSGIQSLTAGSGVTITNVDGSANIVNAWVQSLVVGDGLRNIGTSYNPIIEEDFGGPTTTILYPTGFCVPNPIPATSAPNTYGVMPVVLSPTSKLQNQLTNGTKDAQPCWVFDFTSFWGTWSSFGLYAAMYIGFGDTTTAGGPFYYEAPLGPAFGGTFNGVLVVTPDLTTSGAGNLGFTSVNINDMRSAGLKTIDVVRFRNNITLAAFVLNTITPITATYYNNLTFG